MNGSSYKINWNVGLNSSEEYEIVQACLYAYGITDWGKKANKVCEILSSKIGGRWSALLQSNLKESGNSSSISHSKFLFLVT